MQKLKNWTITAKSVRNGLKGLINYASYLNDANRHKDQEITEITNGIEKMATVAENFNLKRKLSTGGRPSNHAWSAVMSYPFKMNDEQFSKVLAIIASELYDFVIESNNLRSTEEDKKLWLNSISSIVHRGDDIHNHLHTLFPKHFRVFKGDNNVKEVISIDLTKKRYLVLLKSANDKAVEKVMNLSKIAYQIQAKEIQRKKVDQATNHRYKLKKQTLQVEQIIKDTEDILTDLELLRSREEISEGDYESAVKGVNTALKQLDNGNTDRSEKTLQRTKKKVKKFRGM